LCQNPSLTSAYSPRTEVSRSLRDLELQIGATLFERTNAGTHPKLEGQEFLQAAKKILEETEEPPSVFVIARAPKSVD
jgi:DNA-binding transcriptional LysR family regulator